MTLSARKTFHEEIQHRSDDGLQDYLSFIEVDTETSAALQDYLPYLKKVLPHILVEFYEHIRKWPHLASLSSDESRMDEARTAQEKHWLILFEGRFDEAYKNSVREIGLIHSSIGLEPTWYISVYAFTLNRLYTHATRQYQSFFSPKESQAKTARLIRALNQCVMIDIDRMMSPYLEENKNAYETKLNRLADRFEMTVGALVNNISSTATQLEADVENLASMATQVSLNAESISSVSSATKEMSTSITHISHLAQKSHQSAEQAATETDGSITTLYDLKSTIDKVSEVTNLISDIASRINLLTLNAAIEAVRTGDSGKGFSSIVSEVKSLTNATEDIKTQVIEMITKSDSVARSLESVKKNTDDNKLVSWETIQSIVDQKKTLDEISRNIGTVNDGSQGIITATRSILETTKNFSEQDITLRNAVSRFIADVKKGS